MIVLQKVGKSAHIHSVKVPEAGLKNGNVLTLGGVDKTELFDGEIYTATKPTAITDAVVFLANQFLPYDSLREEEKDYVFKKDEVVRAYVLTRGDQILVSKDVISGTAVVGQFVGLAAGSAVLKASATKIEGSLSFIVDELEPASVQLAGLDGVSIRVL